jgi:hypothetical protein
MIRRIIQEIKDTIGFYYREWKTGQYSKTGKYKCRKSKRGFF